MQRKTRSRSIRRLGRSFKTSPSAGVRNLMTRRRLNPEDWVDQMHVGGIRKIRRVLAEKLVTLPAGSAMRAYVERLQGLPDERLMDEIYSHAHANPERADCPPHRILIELASRTRSLDDPAWEHVVNCHPCAKEVRTMTRAYRPRPS